MTATGIIGVPIKGFHLAKGRLADHLDPAQREELMRAVAGKVVAAAVGTGAETLVVTGDVSVAEWAEAQGARVLPEPAAGGLDGAAAAAAEYGSAGSLPWCVVHADLPLLESGHLAEALAIADGGEWAMAPSRTGGTNLIAARRAFRFRYGPASFRRHLAELHGTAGRVLVTTATALDLDTVDDLAGAASLPGGAWLAGFLGG